MPHYTAKHAVIETPDYLADAEDAGISRTERETVVDFLAENPKAGDLIPGPGGARKLRFAGRGKGKRAEAIASSRILVVMTFRCSS